MGSAAGIMRFQPGQPCCETSCCNIDSFSSETEVTGATIRAAIHPQSPYASWLSCKIKAGSGTVVILYLAWGGSDGLYLEIKPGATYSTHADVRIFRKNGDKIGYDEPFYAVWDSTAWMPVTFAWTPDADTPVGGGTNYNPYGNVSVRIGNLGLGWNLPSGFVGGTQAGYGVGVGSTGDVSIKDYDFDRLFCCGVSPFTEDCHAIGDDWDYYYELPERTGCHVSNGYACPITIDSRHTILAGTISITTVVLIKSADSRIMYWNGDWDATQQWGYAITPLEVGDQAVIGMTDPPQDNQVYVTIEVEESGANARLVTNAYTITAGGSPTLISGPTYSDWKAKVVGGFYTITAMCVYDEPNETFSYSLSSVFGLFQVATIDETVSSLVPCRRVLLGSDNFGGAWNQFQFQNLYQGAGYHIRCIP